MSLPRTLLRPCRLVARSCTRLASHPRDARIAIRCFSTGSNSGGIFSNITSKLQSTVHNRRTVAADEKFTQWLSEMMAVRKFHLENFYTMVKSSAEDAGITGWKSMIPGATNQAGAAELKKSLSILEALTAAERADSSLIDRLVKIRAAETAKATVTDVNLLLKQFHSAGVVHSWLHSRAKKGEPLPDSQAQLAQWIQRDRPPQAQAIQRKPRRR